MSKKHSNFITGTTAKTTTWAFFLTGYQEVMGSYHNLSGAPNEAHVVVDNDGRSHVTKIVAGSRITEMMQFARL